MPNTMPEGFTPMPYLVEPPQQAKSRSILVIVSTILGTIIAVGVIVSGLGRAFFVDRSEYTNKLLLDAQDKVSVQKALERIDYTLNRLDETSQKLTTTVQELRDAARGRR
jgi:hypothetical protein